MWMFNLVSIQELNPIQKAENPRVFVGSENRARFRMLQDGKTEDTESLLEVFAKPLENAGTVAMCWSKWDVSDPEYLDH